MLKTLTPIPLFCLCLSFFPASALDAQIFADISVKQGTSELGTFRIELLHESAPRAVANFIGLATGERNWIDPETGRLQSDSPYYDGLTFHRLIHDFMIQGGDPLGTGTGGPGYVFQDEFDNPLSHQEYVVSMANSGACSNGSQFFITLSAPTELDNKHTIFGRVIDDASYPNSRSLIDGFKSSANFPTGTNDSPDTPITIESVVVSGPDLASFDIHDPALGLPPVSGLAMQLEYEAPTNDFYLSWARQERHDYPLYFSTDLSIWNFAGNLLSMDDDPAFRIEINGLATESKTFYQACEVDYRSLPVAPQDVLAAGTVLEFSLDAGTLQVNFDGSGGGTWTFAYDDGVTPDDTGMITSSQQTDTSTYPVIPTNGFYINQSGQTYARYLPVRQITVYFDSSAGPDGVTAIQPTLSYHESSSGWFDGPTDVKGVFIRGPFTMLAP